MLSRPGTFLILAAALALTGCFGKAEPQPIIIGHVSTLSGPGRVPGEHAARGIRLAVEEWERDPGKGPGRPVVVRHADAHGEREAFASEAVRLVAINRVVALLGGDTPAEVERLQKAEVPVVAPEGMRTRAMGDLVFLTGLAPTFQGQTLARFAAQDLAATSAAVLADERRDDAVQLADAFMHTFPGAARKQPATATPAQPALWRFGKSARLEEFATRVREAKPDLLLFAGDPGDLRDFLRALDQPALPVLWAGGDGAASTMDGAPGKALYHITPLASDLDMPLAKTFVDQYRKAFSEEPDVHAALAYDGIRLLGEALRQADNNLSPGPLKDKLAALKDFPGLTGPLSLTPEHQVRRPALVVRLENGRWRTVKRYEPEP